MEDCLLGWEASWSPLVTCSLVCTRQSTAPSRLALMGATAAAMRRKSSASTRAGSAAAWRREAASAITSWIRRSFNTSSARSSPMVILWLFSALANCSLFFFNAVSEALQITRDLERLKLLFPFFEELGQYLGLFLTPASESFRFFFFFFEAATSFCCSERNKIGSGAFSLAIASLQLHCPSKVPPREMD